MFILATIVNTNLITEIKKFGDNDPCVCFNCGNCVRLCPDAFKLDLKHINFEGKDIPVVLRQSDRYGAILLAEELKSLILKGKFPLENPTGLLEFAKEVK